MLVTMQRDVFEMMDDGALISACFKPLIKTYKEVSSKDGDTGDFYRKLTSSQQVLFIFNTYYSHVIESAEEFYWWSAFFLAQEVRWTVLNEKMRELGDLEFVSLLQDVEGILHTRDSQYTRILCNVDLDHIKQKLSQRKLGLGLSCLKQPNK
ncbi:hypothetical protein PaeBR_11475 [Paenibacillus sp. BR2-3]|uniref:hypothetical protein n=1 Tax=Paenibacillus sp. BR2-3 TaxID=3048494 RepID=UPI003977880F